MLQSYTRHASLLSVAPLEENQDTSNQRELRILPGQDFPSVYSLRTRYATLWRVSLVGLTLSDKAFQSLGCFVGLGFLDLSYTNLSLKTIQSALRPIQILSLHIFSCPHLESVERGFLVYTLPNTWSLNGLIPTCTQRVQYKQSYTAGKGRFSEVYRKHFLPFDPKLVPTRLWPVEQAANPNLHEIQIGCLWSPQAKLLASNVPQHFAMGLEQDLWRTKRLAFNLETDILAALHASKADVQVIRSSIEHFISPPSSGSDGSSLNSLDSRSRLLLLLLATMTSGLSIDLFQRALETIFCGSDSQWTASSISPISWPLKYRLIYAAMLLARLSIQSPTDSNFESDLLFTPERVKMTAKLIYVLTEQSYSSYSVLSVRPKSAASQRSSHETSKVRLEGHETQCLALLSLETIRLCCVIPDTSFLLSVLPSLWGAVQVHLGVLFPDKDVREALLKTLDIYDVYPYSFMSYQSSSMSLGAQGLEIRFRILSSLDAIREAWETQQAEILRKADEV